LFHLKGGKMLGGYFGDQSYAATFPQEPEVYVQEIWRVNDQGEFVEMVEGTLGGVIRMSECERVEFLKVRIRESNEEQRGQGDAGSVQGLAGGAVGSNGCGADGQQLAPEQQPNSAEGRVGDGTAENSTCQPRG
jgi:hypothetical protein